TSMRLNLMSDIDTNGLERYCSPISCVVFPAAGRTGPAGRTAVSSRDAGEEARRLSGIPAGRAWEIRQHRWGGGRVSRCERYFRDKFPCQRYTLCGPHAAEVSWFYCCCRHHAGTEHWRKRRGLRRIECAYSAAVECVG